MDGAEDGVFCNLELKIECNDNSPVGCASAKELHVPQFKKGISPTTHLHFPFKKPRLVEEACSLSSGNKLCSKIMESPAGCRLYFQSNNLTGDPGVAADKRHIPSFQTSDEDEDLDDSLLELEEKDDDEDVINLTSEEIDKILQESDDDIDNNFDSLKCGNVSGIGADTLDEQTHNLSSLSPPNTSQLPKSSLVIDDLEASDQGDALMTNVAALKVDDEINQSVKSEKHNQNSIYEIPEIEKSEQPYHITVDSMAAVAPLQGSADEQADERDHTPSSNKADLKTQNAVLSRSSSSLLKEDDNSTMEQNISEEKAADGREKEATDVTECGEDEVPEVKDPRKHQQSVAGSSQEMEPRRYSPPKTGRTDQATSLFSKEMKQKKQQYLKSVLNQVKRSNENQGQIRELHSLMDEVAVGGYHTSRQHHLDLTVRNYRRRHTDRPMIDFYEWSRNEEAPRFLKLAQSLQRGPHS